MNMWSLVILAFWFMPQSSDAATSVTVPGFSSKATCIEAGEQYINDAGREITLKRKSGNGPARYNTTHERSVYYHYQCVEVK